MVDKNKKTGFSQYNISEEIVEALTLLGYLEPTEIQSKVLPHALEGRDIIGKSQTGSGKTAAFAIPLCQMVIWEENAPQALVLEPTRELAVQVSDEIFHIGRNKRIKVPCVFGGLPIDKQTLSLKQKAHVVVGTPGRVLDHIQRENLRLDKIRCLVIDEADLMFDMGFREEVEVILRLLPEKRIIMLFSATMGDAVRSLQNSYMKDAVSILMESDREVVETVEQEICRVENEDKYALLVRLLIRENPDNCLIFCGTREMVNVLCQKMKRNGIRCGMLHGELEQRERLTTIREYREGRFHYLIATDVAARGVDFEKVTHIFNYDFPTGKETYVHRIGRTGRNGNSGKAISFVSEADLRMLKTVEEYIGEKINAMECGKNEEGVEKIFWKRQQEKIQARAQKGAVFHKDIKRLSIGGGKKSKMRAVDIVGTLCSIEGISPEDIGIIDVRDSITYVEVLHEKGEQVRLALEAKPIKGKIRKVRETRQF